jgi:hypothetical protein
MPGAFIVSPGSHRSPINRIYIERVAVYTRPSFHPVPIRFNTDVLGQVALFNLADDPGEFNDRSTDEPAIRTELQQLYDAWISSL